MQNKKPSVGGVWIFSGTAHSAYSYSRKQSIKRNQSSYLLNMVELGLHVLQSLDPVFFFLSAFDNFAIASDPSGQSESNICLATADNAASHSSCILIGELDQELPKMSKCRRKLMKKPC